ncbi:hypothetical protein Nepgr_012497 [Nepenthes gracilis]|uniref:Uncharacterized protein n=1 Tax=Nepenthes gracilis TaxID=150966 RepID=A0AAD3SH31_NEPGR|nr:hypothetical protein Nepgr_012497 [Nepenthes gracilis]
MSKVGTALDISKVLSDFDGLGCIHAPNAAQSFSGRNSNSGCLSKCRCVDRIARLLQIIHNDAPMMVLIVRKLAIIEGKYSSLENQECGNPSI